MFVSISEIVNDVELPKISDESFAIDSGMKRKRGRPLGPSQMDTSLIINNNRLQPNNNLPQLQKRKSQGVAPKEKEGTQSRPAYFILGRYLYIITKQLLSLKKLLSYESQTLRFKV